MAKKLKKSRHGSHFRLALIVITLSIAVSLIAFMGGEKKITGFAVSTSSNLDIQPDLNEFNDVNSLSSLAKGSYYIDEDGIVYWMDDGSMPAIAKINFIGESQKNRNIYIDADGNVGYIIE